MLRSIGLLIAGVIFGLVAGIYFAVPDTVPDRQLRARSTTDEDREAARITASLPAAVATPGGIGAYRERLAYYERALQADTGELVDQLQALATMADSPSRRFAAQVLLTRYAEDDPPNAVALSRSFGADVTAAVYAAWAGRDRGAALLALGREADLAVARQAGLKLVESFGGDSPALLDVIDALPAGIDPLSFQIDALVERARFAPGAALLRASQFADSATRHRALQRIAQDMAARDTAAALAAVETIADGTSRLSFKSQLFAEWASVDPSSLLDHLAAVGMAGEDAQMIGGREFAALAAVNPERLLDLAAHWPGTTGQQARIAALHAWAEIDPQQASNFAMEMPLGQDRENLLRSVARSLGEADADAAIAWADSLRPRPRGVLTSIIDGIARKDANRAFDLALSQVSNAAQLEAMQGVIMRTAYRDVDATHIASRVLAIEDGQLRQQSLQMLAYSWTSNDPASAMNWLAAHSTQLPKESFQALARQLAESNPQLAANFTPQVPLASRAGWIQQVAAGIARSDPVAATNWLSQYQGEPGYDLGLAQVAEQTAVSDPLGAARNIERFPDAANAVAVARVAGREWARQDPQSAASWAANIANEQVRNTAITNVARQWAQQDADGAARWALQLPAGTARDSALISAMSGIARARVPEEKLFAAFSGDMARQQAAVYASYRLARTDRAAAAQLVDRYITDPTLRAQAEQNLASISRY